MTKRNLEEQDFFSRNIWRQTPADLLGVSKLRPCLSTVLTEHIGSELPSLLDEITLELGDCRKELEKMGQRRANKDEQQQYLVTVSMKFQSLIKASINGVYNDSFFEDVSLTADTASDSGP